MVKFIVISGSLSSIGKGVLSSSTGMLMRHHGFKVTSIKIDPYLNVDAGTMSPYEHGEVYVLDDGGEVDLDLGNYERIIGLTLTKDNNITTGKIYNNVIMKERRGDYLGKTVQVVPHICDEIKHCIDLASKIPTDGQNDVPDICVIELGGTVGDIESLSFIEALRQLQSTVGKENFCLMHVCFVPIFGEEQKTKLVQKSVSELRSLGVFPDFIVCRCASVIEKCSKQKISQFCHIPEDNVISVHDVSNLYRIPLMLMDQHLPCKILQQFKLNYNVPNLLKWHALANSMDTLNDKTDGIRIAIVGKYTGLSDAYHSITKGIQHASLYLNKKVIVQWVEAEKLEDNYTDKSEYKKMWNIIENASGYLIPGGYSVRGTEGMISVAEYARLFNKPYLGICLGMQIAVIEFVRNVLHIKYANSEEFDNNTPNKVIMYMPEVSKDVKGGTMRLGARDTYFKGNSQIRKLYENLWGSTDKISERHRHRYEVNIKYIDDMEKNGLMFVGKDISGERQEIVELKDHKYFVGVQYHPEMKTRPLCPSPPFVGLLMACE